jgi:probable HAF family extracellular repeat protein
LYNLTTAVLWTKVGGLIDIGPFNATALNDWGQVVGVGGPSGNSHAFSWTRAGGKVDLGDLGGDYSFAHAVNNLGQVVGMSNTVDTGWHAFFWTSTDGMIDLGSIGGSAGQATGGGTTSQAVAVNNRGQVAGFSNTSSGDAHATLWEAKSASCKRGDCKDDE